MKVNFVDLKRQNAIIKKSFLKNMEEIIDNASFIGGNSIDDFEKTFSKKIGVKHTICVSSGTTALISILHSLGIKNGDEIIVPANTFAATAEAVVAVGATPVFADCDSKSYNIDYNVIEKLITKYTKAIIGVHLYGNPFNFDEINNICNKYGLYCIEDSAQAHFAKYKNKFCGSLGLASAFSFYPSKNLGALGQGGAVCTNNDELAYTIRRYINHGTDGKYIHHIMGTNFKMSSLIASGLNLKLNYIDEWTDNRRKNAELYKKNLFLPSIFVNETNDPVWHLFPIHTNKRDELSTFLNSNGISTGKHYPIPLHKQESFKKYVDDNCVFPNAEYNAYNCLSLPMHEFLTEEEIMYVCEQTNKYILSV